MRKEITETKLFCDICKREIFDDEYRICKICGREICDICGWVYGDFDEVLRNKVPADIFHTNFCVKCFKIPEVRKQLQGIYTSLKLKTKKMIRNLSKKYKIKSLERK